MARRRRPTPNALGKTQRGRVPKRTDPAGGHTRSWARVLVYLVTALLGTGGLSSLILIFGGPQPPPAGPRSHSGTDDPPQVVKTPQFAVATGAGGWTYADPSYDVRIKLPADPDDWAMCDTWFNSQIKNEGPYPIRWHPPSQWGPEVCAPPEIWGATWGEPLRQLTYSPASRYGTNIVQACTPLDIPAGSGAQFRAHVKSRYRSTDSEIWAIRPPVEGSPCWSIALVVPESVPYAFSWEGFLDYLGRTAEGKEYWEARSEEARSSLWLRGRWRHLAAPAPEGPADCTVAFDADRVGRNLAMRQTRACPMPDLVEVVATATQFGAQRSAGQCYNAGVPLKDGDSTTSCRVPIAIAGGVPPAVSMEEDRLPPHERCLA